MKRCHEQISSFTSKRVKHDRDSLLDKMREWCSTKNITLSPKVTFGPGCAGHGLLAVDDITVMGLVRDETI